MGELGSPCQQATLGIVGSLPAECSAQCRIAAASELLEMVLGVPERKFDGGESLEVVTDAQLLGNSHPAMQLYRLLAD